MLETPERGIKGGVWFSLIDTVWNPEHLEAYLKQGVMESGKEWTPTEQGTTQGAVLSPLLANLYLNPLDHMLARKSWEMTRYADEFIVQCHAREEAEKVLGEIREWVENVGLTLHPTKTRIVNASEHGGGDFLGWHFERGHKWPREKSLNRFMDREFFQRTDMNWGHESFLGRGLRGLPSATTGRRLMGSRQNGSLRYQES